MKRHSNLYEQVYNIHNLEAADRQASLGKSKQPGVIKHRQNPDMNLMALQNILMDKTYRTSPYVTATIHDPKERTIYCLPYFPDRIVHHAIVNVMKPIWVSTFTADTYSCIEGRGVHKASYRLRKALKNQSETTYCLKLDIVKYYPSVDHGILKTIIRKKIKDQDMLNILDEIIDSAPGLPIGNYLSQYLANLYLTYFDHWVKENLGVKHYFRYADDMVFLSSSKTELHTILAKVRTYLREKLNLQVKGNYQVFPVAKRGIDVFGYIHYHHHTLLRKSIKQRFARMLAKRPNRASIAAYNGWAKHCNSKHLIKKLNDQFQGLKHQGRNERLCRQEDGNNRYPEHRNHSTRLEGRKEHHQTRTGPKLPSPIVRT
ncbi:MAG TPA: RNA-directed DNA polymerase [Parapedobacter sp.]|uniref:RNA-directed DNA polymerase n=1 Tax=Parapedobacter sp. TaxID=1958893 RepID=UPI002BB4065C|nr:RNA-directed DNA polymerase [Parapedobacter sp.]HWK58136.1 RNA-directed DNA polymerase [Parapedobacter sp.]